MKGAGHALREQRASPCRACRHEAPDSSHWESNVDGRIETPLGDAWHKPASTGASHTHIFPFVRPVDPDKRHPYRQHAPHARDEVISCNSNSIRRDGGHDIATNTICSLCPYILTAVQLCSASTSASKPPRCWHRRNHLPRTLADADMLKTPSALLPQDVVKRAYKTLRLRRACVLTLRSPPVP